MALNAEVAGYDDCKYIYNINGVDSEITTDTMYLADVAAAGGEAKPLFLCAKTELSHFWQDSSFAAFVKDLNFAKVCL